MDVGLRRKIQARLLPVNRHQRGEGFRSRLHADDEALQRRSRAGSIRGLEWIDVGRRGGSQDRACQSDAEAEHDRPRDSVRQTPVPHEYPNPSPAAIDIVSIVTVPVVSSAARAGNTARAITAAA